MSAVAMIFNGVHFGQAVADKAFAYAKQSGGDVVAIFLKAAHEKKEGYGFPSDIAAAETITTDADADNDDKAIIESNMRMLQHEAIMQKIDVQSHLLENPHQQQLILLLKNCTLIFIQGHDEHGKETPAGIDVKKLLTGVSIPVEIVA